MKRLKQFIIEARKRKLYHVSRERIGSLTESPMFFYEDIKESNALVKNFKMDDTDAFQYVCEVPSTANFPMVAELEDAINEKDFNKLSEYEIDIVSNPTAEDLTSICDDIEKILKKNSVDVDGLSITDYSQINPNNDATSILVFHPNKTIQNFKLK